MRTGRPPESSSAGTEKELATLSAKTRKMTRPFERSGCFIVAQPRAPIISIQPIAGPMRRREFTHVQRPDSNITLDLSEDIGQPCNKTPNPLIVSLSLKWS